MLDIIDLIVTAFSDFLKWYSTEALQGENIIEFFIKQLTFYILLQMALFFIPFLKRVLVVLFLPFRWVHVYLHVYTAKQVLREINDRKDQGEKTPLLDDGNLRASLISGLDVPDENPGLLLAVNRFDYAKRVALASQKISLVMLFGYFIVTPFFLADSSIITSQTGALIHLYLFLGIFGVLMPSINDWYFVLHALMINMQLRPIWLYNSIIVYLVFTFDTILRTQNFFLSILLGTIWFVIYIIGLFVVSYIAKRGTIRKSTIFWLPLERTGKDFSQRVGIDYLSLEDIDL